MFELVDFKDILNNILIFDIKFIDKIKNKKTEQIYEKLYFVV